MTISDKPSQLWDKAAQQHCHLAFHHQIPLNIRSSQIQVAVPETQVVFGLRIFLNGKGRLSMRCLSLLSCLNSF